MTRKLSAVGVVFAIILSTSIHSAFAVGSGGFENASFSGYALSQSNAVTAQPDEPAAMSYNPAGIADLKGVQAQFGDSMTSVFTHISHSTGDTTSSGTPVQVPTTYFTVNPGEVFNDRLTFGIGSDSPFGLLNKYDSNQLSVRYTGWRNWLKMYTLKPTIALKVTNQFSVAGSAMNYRVFDYGAIQAYPNVLGGGTGDGQLRLNTSGSAWGWQLGALLKAHKHHLGFYYRSPVNLKVKGRLKVENSNVLGGSSANFQTGTYADVDFPMNMTLGYAYDIKDRTTVELDLGYTRWSTFERIHIHTDPVDATNDAVLAAIGIGTENNNKQYRDGFSVHLGGHHDLNDNLQLRAGSLFYTASVPKHHFSPAVPDSNRLGFSVGTGYKLSDYAKIDLSYLYILGLRRSINNDISIAVGGDVDGRYTSHYHVFTISMTLMWEDIFDRKAAQTKSEMIDTIPSPILTE